MSDCDNPGIAYWKALIKNKINYLDLPLDNVRQKHPKQLKKEYSVHLDLKQLNFLKDLSSRYDCSLEILLLALFSILMSRYSRQNQLIIGAITLNNIVPLVFEINHDEELAKHLLNTKQLIQEARHHQEVSFEQLLELVDINQDESMPKLIQVFFALDSKAKTPPHFDLSFRFEEKPDGLECIFSYAAEIFKEKTMKRLSMHGKNLLLSCEQATKPIHSLSHLDEEEYQMVVQDSHLDTIKHAVLSEAFEEQVKKSPHATALIFEDQRFTYLQLNELSNQLAHYLIEQGVRVEKKVAICLKRSAEFVIAILATIKAGGCYIPIDPANPEERIKCVIDDAQPLLFITEKNLFKMHFSSTLVFIHEFFESSIKNYSNKNPGIKLSSFNAAYIIYTSGSTGVPKGVVIEHASVMNTLQCDTFSKGEPSKEIIAQNISFGFDGSVYALWWPLLHGGSVCLLSDEALHNYETLFNVLSKNQVTALFMTPSFFNGFTHIHHYKLPNSIHTINLGGEILHSELAKLVLEQNNVRIINIYGPTECCIFATYHKVEKDAEYGFSVPIGRNIQNMSLYILDSYLKPTGLQIPGELYIAGVGLARGYLNRPDLTDKHFIPNPFSKNPQEKMYKTGDVCRFLENGEVEYLSRVDHQVKINGYRIEIGEIESAIKKYDGIVETVVVVHEDNMKKKRLVAYIVPKNNHALAVDDIKKFIAERLPDYMMPNHFICVDEIPLNSNGKKDVKSLPVPELKNINDYVEPRNSLEKKLCDLFREILNIEKVGVFDNFFEIGGDSILSIQLVSRMAQINLHCDFKDVFKYPSVAELALNIEEKMHADDNFKGEVFLTDSQKRFFNKKLSDANHFSEVKLLAFKKDCHLSPEAIEIAVRATIAAHPLLFATFSVSPEGVISQSYSDKKAKDFEIINYEIPENSSEEEYIKDLASQERTHLNIHGQLFRLLFVRGVGTVYLIWIIHPLIIDEVSWHVLLDDFCEALQQYREGKHVGIALETNSFKDWATHISPYAQTINPDYWLNLPKPALLEPDKQANHLADAKIKQVKLHLNKEDTRLILQDLPLVYQTIIEVILLTTLCLSLCQWRHLKEVSLLYKEQKRNRLFSDIDTSRIVGNFTAFAPFHFNLPDNPDLKQIINSLKNELQNNTSIDFSLLRYLSKNEAIKEKLSCFDNLPIVVHYSDNSDKNVETNFFKQIPVDNNLNEDKQENALLTINGEVSDDRLIFTFNYLDLLWEKQSIEDLANICKRNLKQLILSYSKDLESVSTLPSSPYAKKSPYIVPLSQNQNKPVIILFYPANGTIELYQYIAHELAPYFSVFAVPAKGYIEGIHHRTIDEAALFYAEQIVHYFKNKVLCLGGWCFGGNLASKVASILQNHYFLRLVFFDTNFLKNDPDYKFEEQITADHLLQNLFSYSYSLYDQQKATLNEFIKRFSKISDHETPSFINTMSEAIGLPVSTCRIICCYLYANQQIMMLKINPKLKPSIPILNIIGRSDTVNPAKSPEKELPFSHFFAGKIYTEYSSFSHDRLMEKDSAVEIGKLVTTWLFSERGE